MSQACIFCTDPDVHAAQNCSLNFAEAIGIDIAQNEGVYNIQIPDGITIDTVRLNNSWTMINQQLPTGSLTGYVDSLFTSVGTSLSTNAKQTLGIILGTVILVAFLLYTIICIVLIAYGVIGIAMGISLIFIGLIISVIALVVSFSEAYRLGNALEKDLFNGAGPVLDTLSCAFLSGICCYIGASCTCPDGSCVTCLNPPIPPPN